MSGAIAGPCPFCGFRTLRAQSVAWLLDVHEILCTHCRASGPHANTERLAWHKWNERALTLNARMMRNLAGPDEV